MYYTRSHYSRDMQALHFMRRKMVVYAQQHSIKAAARRFEASRNTVRLWLRRYQADPSARLVNARPPSTNHPQKMSYGWQQTICDAVLLCIARGQRVIAKEAPVCCFKRSIQILIHGFSSLNRLKYVRYLIEKSSMLGRSWDELTA